MGFHPCLPAGGVDMEENAEKLLPLLSLRSLGIVAARACVAVLRKVSDAFRVGRGSSRSRRTPSPRIGGYSES